MTNSSAQYCPKLAGISVLCRDCPHVKNCAYLHPPKRLGLATTAKEVEIVKSPDFQALLPKRPSLKLISARHIGDLFNLTSAQKGDLNYYVEKIDGSKTARGRGRSWDRVCCIISLYLLKRDNMAKPVDTWKGIKSFYRLGGTSFERLQKDVLEELERVNKSFLFYAKLYRE